jgi:carboxylesterase
MHVPWDDARRGRNRVAIRFPEARPREGATVTDPASTLLPGAEPFEAAPSGAGDGARGARIGVLLCHGFTGSPQSLRPWAQHLLEAGFRVAVPLLPGHGTHWKHLQLTTWEDWYGEVDAALRRLLAECDDVYVMGLSMGGGLALRLAEQHGSAIRGLVVVNPSVQRNRSAEALIPMLSRVLPSFPGVASDIKRPDVREVAYDRVPLKAALSLTRFWTVVAADLSKVTIPVLLVHSTVDHVVHPSNSALVLERISSQDVQEIVLADSYHVATLDNDAQTIYDGSVAFIRRLSAVAAAGPSSEAGSAEAHT